MIKKPKQGSTWQKFYLKKIFCIEKIFLFWVSGFSRNLPNFTDFSSILLIFKEFLKIF